MVVEVVVAGAPARVSATVLDDVAAAVTACAALDTADAVDCELLPGTRSALLSSIQGNAVTSQNGALVNTAVRLRDARMGRIVESVTTDKQGMFAFKGVDPGNYVVEIMSPANNGVLASSQVMNVGSVRCV